MFSQERYHSIQPIASVDHPELVDRGEFNFIRFKFYTATACQFQRYSIKLPINPTIISSGINEVPLWSNASKFLLFNFQFSFDCFFYYSRIILCWISSFLQAIIVHYQVPIFDQSIESCSCSIKMNIKTRGRKFS